MSYTNFLIYAFFGPTKVSNPPYVSRYKASPFSVFLLASA